jgi:hypothetical protein
MTPAWHVFFDSLWKDFDVRFHGILQSLVRHRDLVDKEASSLAIVEVRSWTAQHRQEVERQEMERQAAYFQESISWLSIEDHVQADDLDRMVQLREPLTCEWILGTPQLASWIEDPDARPILWLNGIPGAGMHILY